jgi:hypothetical protein
VVESECGALGGACVLDEFVACFKSLPNRVAKVRGTSSHLTSPHGYEYLVKFPEELAKSLHSSKIDVRGQRREVGGKALRATSPNFGVLDLQSCS